MPILVVAASAVGLGFGEAGLRLLERVRTPVVRVEPHPVLGSKVPDNAPGHDARGFRNAIALDHAEIVALGDSQTWGVNAPVDGAWPQQLARITGRSVYNVSQGSFGTLHYAALFDLARQLRPKLVLVAVYLGNDLYDSYRLAYQADHWAKLRLPDAGLERDTLEPRASALWAEHERTQAEYGRASPRLWGEWLQGHTAIGRLLERAGVLRTDVWHNAGAAWARAHPENGAVCEGPVRTILTTAYRLIAVDDSDPRIREGMRISAWALDSMRKKAATDGLRLLVVVIPTKERVHADVMRASSPLDPVHARLVAEEDERRRELLAVHDSLDIEFVDLLPVLSASVAAGQALYPTTTESHPNSTGYSVIADTIRRAIDRPVRRQTAE